MIFIFFNFILFYNIVLVTACFLKEGCRRPLFFTFPVILGWLRCDSAAPSCAAAAAKGCQGHHSGSSSRAGPPVSLHLSTPPSG